MKISKKINRSFVLDRLCKKFDELEHNFNEIYFLISQIFLFIYLQLH